jgi:threonine/homoserine/homoserine lactone efflux protein
MGLWSALFLENWKRTEKTTAMKWGMVGYEEDEQPRPQFKGEKTLSPVTGKPEVYYPQFYRTLRETFSQAMISILIFLVIAVIACVFAIRVLMAKANFAIAGVQMASIISSILLAIQIQILNAVFSDVALRLTNQENHRTDTEYEDSLIGKTFLFQFVNSYTSLFYISFVKPFIPGIDPCTVSCMLELQTTLGTIFLTRLALGNLTELGIPMFTTYMENRKRKEADAKQSRDFLDMNNNNNNNNNGIQPNVNNHSISQVSNSSLDGVELSLSQPLNNGLDPAETLPHIYESAAANAIHGGGTTTTSSKQEDGRHDMSEIEKTFTMEEYHVMLGTFDDYAEMAIQFGYTTMFIAGFPLATVLSFVNNYVEIRVDAWKLLHVCRRPEPRSCEDIGTWAVILETVSYASIFVNSAIVAFTTTIPFNYTWVERIWLFILMATGLFCIRMMVAYLIPDVPEEVEIQLARQEYIVRKVVLNVPDDEEERSQNNFLVPNFRILATDDDPL